jgi:hypothetical protein
VYGEEIRQGSGVKEDLRRSTSPEVARSHGINDMAIHWWLERDTGMVAAET